MIIYVKAKPNAKEEKITKLSDGEYEISIKEPAENNKANIKLINLLAKEFGVSYKNVKIKNPTSRKKVVEIKE